MRYIVTYKPLPTDHPRVWLFGSFETGIIFQFHPMTYRVDRYIMRLFSEYTFKFARIQSNWDKHDHLNIKLPSYQYTDFHDKDKTVSLPSFL